MFVMCCGWSMAGFPQQNGRYLVTTLAILRISYDFFAACQTAKLKYFFVVFVLLNFYLALAALAALFWAFKKAILLTTFLRTSVQSSFSANESRERASKTVMGVLSSRTNG